MAAGVVVPSEGVLTSASAHTFTLASLAVVVALKSRCSDAVVALSLVLDDGEDHG